MTGNHQGSTKSCQPPPSNNGGIYEIKIRGHLDDHWKQWFEEMTLKHVENGEQGQECTLLTGLVVDQPALHGLLAKTRDLNLTLISVTKITLKDSDSLD